MELARSGGTANCIAASAAPKPVISSRQWRWSGVVVEVYRGRELDLAADHAEHVVAVQLPDQSAEPERAGVKGNVTITPAGTRHTWRCIGDAGLEIVRVAPSVLDATAGEELREHGGRVRLGIHTGIRDAQIEYLGARFLDELQAGQRASRACVASLVSLLSIHLVRHYAAPSDQPDGRCGGLPSYKLRQATEYITRNLCDDLSLEKIAGAVCMSACHFAHVFKQTTGRAPYRYVTECRMARAKALLRETDLPVNEVAARVGYSNHSHFATVFRQFTGQAPLRYRRSA